MKKNIDIESKQSQTSEEKTPDQIKRDFIKKFGTFAASAPLGMFLLMSPSQSKAIGSDTGP